MGEKKHDDGSFGVAVFALLVACFAIGVSICAIASQAKSVEPCNCKPAPTPAPCCKADEFRQEFAKVDARFGGVWDELVEVQEQLAKLKACDCGPVKECACDPAKACRCGPSKPCACSDKPACECKPSKSCECKPPKVKAQLPRHLIFKRCK